MRRTTNTKQVWGDVRWRFERCRNCGKEIQVGGDKEGLVAVNQTLSCSLRSAAFPHEALALSKPQPPFCGLEKNQCWVTVSLKPNPLLWNMIWGIRSTHVLPGRNFLTSFLFHRLDCDIGVIRYLPSRALAHKNSTENCIDTHMVIARDCKFNLDTFHSSTDALGLKC